MIIKSQELPELAEYRIAFETTEAQIVAIHQRGGDSELVYKKTTYDVVTQLGVPLKNVLPNSNVRGSQDTYREQDWVIVQHTSTDQWRIVGSIQNEPPTLSGEQGYVDPDGRTYNKSNALGNISQSSSGTLDLSVKDEKQLHSEDKSQEALLKRKKLLEQLPILMQSALQPLILGALQPIITSAVNATSLPYVDKMAGLNIFGVKASLSLSDISKAVSNTESKNNVNKIITQIISAFTMFYQIHKQSCDLMTIETVFPTNEEIQKYFEDYFKDNLPSILIAILKTKSKEKQPGYRSQIKRVVTAATNTLLPIISKTLTSILGGF